MANRIQQVIVKTLGKPDMHATGIKVIAETMVRAAKADATAASEALAICAEIFRQGHVYPPVLVPFLIIALDRAATSNEACIAIATLGGSAVKAGAHSRQSQDSEVFAHEISLREKIPKEAARVAHLAEHYHRSEEGIRTILKRASKSQRAIDQVLSQVRGSIEKPSRKK